MRTSPLVLVLGSFAIAAIACHHAPPPPPPPPRTLGDSAAAALRWVDAHAAPFDLADSVASSAERSQLATLAGSARVFGFSELSEGSHEFPYIVRRTVLGLAASGRARGLAIQAPMPEAMEVDRYVRGGPGDPIKLLRTLGNWRWETHEMRALVEALRAWNAGKPREQQVGFYGFEIPTAEHAVQVVTSLPDPVVGAPLKVWLARQYSCVALDEGAHWGLEGRTADSSYWNACGPETSAALDSIVALRRRVSPSSRSAADVEFAEEMARLIQHHVRTGLRHLKREDLDAEHVLYLADLTGPDGMLVLWGGDVEMGRLTLEKTTVQTGLALGARLGDRYRNVAFAFGTGILRARAAGLGGQRGGGGVPDLSDVTIMPPLPDTYEEVFERAPPAAYWLDLRSLPKDIAGAWLRGPRSMRLITELYLPRAPEASQTPAEFPNYFDAVVFARHVTAAKQ
ncbi:MAG: erythromycin esterase family protein [Gemmatimonadaceae bacterium]